MMICQKFRMTHMVSLLMLSVLVVDTNLVLMMNQKVYLFQNTEIIGFLMVFGFSIKKENQKNGEKLKCKDN